MLRACFVSLALFAVSACGGGAATPPKPPGAPPTPATVTRAQPGGDAADPHAAALDRLLTEPFGERSDRDDQLLVALPDHENWKRVRFWGVDHFLGFRYGEDHHAMVIVFVEDTPEEQPTSELCIRKFEAWGRPQIKSYDVKFEPFQAHHGKFFDRPLVGLAVDGSVNLGFSRTEFSAGWAAYAYYPHACMVMAVAVPWRDRPERAKRVRDRFLNEGFPKSKPLTDTRPYRKPR
jgi:hypothetical protein